nr:TPA_asm: m102.2 sORF *1 [Murid betaherpesvirus 1]DBA08046.1 TPA_asm: m102.2 sORF *1 [Murid betaherpesvirus 1]
MKSLVTTRSPSATSQKKHCRMAWFSSGRKA